MDEVSAETRAPAPPAICILSGKAHLKQWDVIITVTYSYVFIDLLCFLKSSQGNACRN